MAFGRVNEVEQMFLILQGIMVLPLNDSPSKGVRGGGVMTWRTNAVTLPGDRRVNIALTIKS